MKHSSRDQRQLHDLLLDARSAYVDSQFAKNIEKQLLFLAKSVSSPITRLLSLGLGSLCSPERGQARRLKQLAVLLFLREGLQKLSNGPVEVYAQDPTFTRQDEALLATLNIRVSRTSSGSSLGEAATLLSPSTVVYSPFLTLEAYEQLFVQSKQPAPYLIGDDFDALLGKWPKHSAERAQVEKVKRSVLGRYRRRAISGSGFWETSDGAFPMAVYAIQSNVNEKAKI